MAKYITLKCIDCNYVKVYPQRTADGHRCPNCNSSLFVPNIIEMSKEEHERITLRKHCNYNNNLI